MDGRKFTILIVDDDANLRSIYAYNFNNANFTVIEANDGLEGLNLAKQHKPDVIFTGIMMPNMDGWELLTLLKDNVETSNIPVLISSHLGKEEDRKKALTLGARDFLVKGMISPVEVVALVKDILTKKSYKLHVDLQKGDGSAMLRDLNLTAPIVLELKEGTGPLEFTAKLVKEEAVKFTE